MTKIPNVLVKARADIDSNGVISREEAKTGDVRQGRYIPKKFAPELTGVTKKLAYVVDQLVDADGVPTTSNLLDALSDINPVKALAPEGFAAICDLYTKLDPQVSKEQASELIEQRLSEVMVAKKAKLAAGMEKVVRAAIETGFRSMGEGRLSTAASKADMAEKNCLNLTSMTGTNSTTQELTAKVASLHRDLALTYHGEGDIKQAIYSLDRAAALDANIESESAVRNVRDAIAADLAPDAHVIRKVGDHEFIANATVPQVEAWLRVNAPDHAVINFYDLYEIDPADLGQISNEIGEGHFLSSTLVHIYTSEHSDSGEVKARQKAIYTYSRGDAEGGHGRDYSEVPRSNPGIVLIRKRR